MSTRWLHVSATLLVAAGCSKVRPIQDDSRDCVNWQQDVQAVLAGQCGECHAGAEPAADYATSSYLGVLGSGQDGVANAIAGEQMVGNTYREMGVSTSTAIEHNKHARPYDEDGALTIPTFTGSSTAGKLYNDGGILKFDGRPLGHKVLGAKGQLLENLVGICDGRSVTVASGTYTLEDVTAIQKPGITGRAQGRIPDRPPYRRGA